MKPEQVKEVVGTLPYMKLRDARIFYDLITAHQLCSVLELGFLHGVSTAYIAGAVQDAGGGSVVTIDLLSAQEREPHIHQLLDRCGLQQMVEVIYEAKTFNWRLMKFLEETPRRRFDLVYIDGAHTWVDTGFAYCLCRMLLRPGGWIVFDDITHTFRNSKSQDKPWVRRMPEEEQVTPQVERVFSLLALQDEAFDTFRIKGAFGFAHKRLASMPASPETLVVEHHIADAAQRAHSDADFRQRLLRYPDRMLAEVSGEPIATFRHVRFLESMLWSPSEPDLDEHGILTHFLERPAWDKQMLEEELIELLA